VPKILVADDNSNIQKMVTLALAEHGMEVIAVGNGEVAVRRLPDVKPDLILADVFMPVRNGYEVCEFVKNDPLFAHIPVILLVGAFDPLDEKEAHRVAADGILKKPFVPPDPLIAMVVGTLERCKNASIAAHQAEAAATAAAAPPPVKQVDIPLPPPPTVLLGELAASGSEDSHQMGPGRADLIDSQDQQMGLDTTPSWRKRAMDLQVPDGVSAAAFEASVSESNPPAPADGGAALASPAFLDAGPEEGAAAAAELNASFPETASIGTVGAEFANHHAHSDVTELAAAPVSEPEPDQPSVAPAAHEAAALAPEPVSLGKDPKGAGWMNVVAPAPPVKNPSGWTVMVDSPVGSVPWAPNRLAPPSPSGVGAATGLSAASHTEAKLFPAPSDSSIAEEMSRLFTGLVSAEAAAVAADAAAIEVAPPLSSSSVEAAASEVSHGSPEAAAESETRPSGLEFEGDEDGVSSYGADQSGTEIAEVEGLSATGGDSTADAGLVTPIEGMTDEGASQYTIGPTQLDVEDTVAVNFAGSQAADLHSPLENAPEPPPPPTPQVATEFQASIPAAPAAAAAAPPAAHLDIDAAVMEAAVKRVLERLEPHLHEILSNGVLRPLIENALQKELEKK
jgi:CheY-like chemotaxis protein